MRNIDEILAEAKGKRFDRLQPHTHETRTAVEPVAESKAAPTVVKTHKSRKISTRGLLLLLVLGIAGIGTVAGLASTGTLSGGHKSPTPTPTITTMSLNVEIYSFNSTTLTVTLRNFGGSTYNLTSYSIPNQGTHSLSQLSYPNGATTLYLNGTFQATSTYTVTVFGDGNTQFSFTVTHS